MRLLQQLHGLFFGEDPARKYPRVVERWEVPPHVGHDERPGGKQLEELLDQPDMPVLVTDRRGFTVGSFLLFHPPVKVEQVLYRGLTEIVKPVQLAPVNKAAKITARAFNGSFRQVPVSALVAEDGNRFGRFHESRFPCLGLRRSLRRSSWVRYFRPR